MAKAKAAGMPPSAATDGQKRSRTVYLTDAEWAEINAQASAEARGAGRHIVFVIQERAAAK